MINWGQSLSAPTTNGRNDKKIEEISPKVLILAPEFASFFQKVILKIFQNW